MKKVARFSCIWGVALCAVTFVIPLVRADQPQGVGFSLLSSNDRRGDFKLGTNDPGDHQVSLNLFASHADLRNSYLLVKFPGCGEDSKVDGKPVTNLDEIIAHKDTASPSYVRSWVAPGPRWRICADKTAVLIRPKSKASLGVSVDFLRAVSEGVVPRLYGVVYEVPRAYTRLDKSPEKLMALLANEQPISNLVIDLNYKLNGAKRTWTLGTYASVFGAGESPDQAVIKKATVDYVAASMPVHVGSYRRTMRLPGDFEDDNGRRLKNTVEIARRYGSGKVGDGACGEDDEYGYHPGGQDVKEVSPSGTDYSVSGLFSTKWTTDHVLHPGFGFRVEAWTNESGSWAKLASDWVQSDGTWSLSIPGSANFQGTLLRVLYRSYNSYYKPQTQTGDTYSWRDPDWLNISTTFSTGHRVADTDGNAYNGLGELVDSAMYMWSRLYWIGGINPVPSAALNLYFPNTWANCGGAAPWSCADTSGNIWLIAAHGIQAAVVTHELSHQLNNKYWGGKRPAGSGGAHSLNTCYPAKLGMAMREGFADFLPAWVGYPERDVASGGFNSGRWSLGYDVESNVAPPSCANGWENEVWVARTFWDLHDTHTDGDDVLWFTHRGAVPLFYLNNGISNDGDARDMRDYEAIYKDAATDGHEHFIEDIFNQNRH